MGGIFQPSQYLASDINDETDIEHVKHAVCRMSQLPVPMGAQEVAFRKVLVRAGVACCRDKASRDVKCSCSSEGP